MPMLTHKASTDASLIVMGDDACNRGSPGEGSKLRIRFQVLAAFTKPGDSVTVVGSRQELGSWSPRKGLPLTTSPTSFPFWRGEVAMVFSEAEQTEFQYKVVVLSAAGNCIWEATPNRMAVLPMLPEIRKLPTTEDWALRTEWEGPDAIPSCCGYWQAVASPPPPPPAAGASSSTDAGASDESPGNASTPKVGEETCSRSREQQEEAKGSAESFEEDVEDQEKRCDEEMPKEQKYTMRREMQTSQDEPRLSDMDHLAEELNLKWEELQEQWQWCAAQQEHLTAARSRLLQLQKGNSSRATSTSAAAASSGASSSTSPPSASSASSSLSTTSSSLSAAPASKSNSCASATAVAATATPGTSSACPPRRCASPLRKRGAAVKQVVAEEKEARLLLQLQELRHLCQHQTKEVQTLASKLDNYVALQAALEGVMSGNHDS